MRNSSGYFGAEDAPLVQPALYRFAHRAKLVAPRHLSVQFSSRKIVSETTHTEEHRREPAGFRSEVRCLLLIEASRREHRSPGIGVEAPSHLKSRSCSRLSLGSNNGCQLRTQWKGGMLTRHPVSRVWRRRIRQALKTRLLVRQHQRYKPARVDRFAKVAVENQRK